MLRRPCERFSTWGEGGGGGLKYLRSGRAKQSKVERKLDSKAKPGWVSRGFRHLLRSDEHILIPYLLQWHADH